MGALNFDFTFRCRGQELPAVRRFRQGNVGLRTAFFSGSTLCALSQDDRYLTTLAVVIDRLDHRSRLSFPPEIRYFDVQMKS